jgi:hypothetical protein
MPIHSDFVKILSRFKRQYGAEDGERLFYAWLNKHDLDPDKAYNIQAQLSECIGGICEAFNWAQPLFALYKEDEDARYYKTKALTANVSMNENDYRDATELARAAPTLSWRPLNMNHDHSNWLPFPEARVDWAAFEDNSVEAIIRIPNSLEQIQSAIENGDILHVSIEGEPRAGVHTDEGRAPLWYNFTALALLEKDVTLPGDPLTYLEPLYINESMGRGLVESLSNVEQPKEEEKMSEDKDEKQLTEAEARNESCAQCSRFLEYLPTTVKTDKVDASEPSDGHILTREGGVGPGVGECQVSKQLVRKNDAACTDWRQRSTPTSADNTERISEDKVESVEEMVMKSEIEELKAKQLELLKDKNREIDAHVETRKNLVESTDKLLRKEKEYAVLDKKNTRISLENHGLKEQVDRLKDANSTLEVENGGLLKERDLYKNEAKRFEESYDKLKTSFKESKDELTRTLTQLHDAKADKATAVQRSLNAEEERSRAVVEVAELIEKLTDVHRQLSESIDKRATSSKQVLKALRENADLQAKVKTLVDEIRALKRKVGKPPKIIIRT